ncbi:MAG: hypothetical protein Q7T94_11365 [Rugosibacter sp.]|nr:hypothetical protein [Rugosibacter sp.]
MSDTPAGCLRLWLSREYGLQVRTSFVATGMQAGQWGAAAHTMSGVRSNGRWT